MLEQRLGKSAKFQNKFYTWLRFELTTSELIKYANDRNIDISAVPLGKRKTKQYLVNRILAAGSEQASA